MTEFSYLSQALDDYVLKNESRAIVDVVSSSLKRIQSSLLGDKDCSDDKAVIAKAAAKIKEQIQANADKAKRKQALGKSSGGLMESLGVVPVDGTKGGGSRGGRSNKSDRRMEIDSDGSMDVDSGSEAVPAKASKSTPKSAAARKPRASAKASAVPPAIQPAAAKRTARSAAKVRA